jgi:hypothetical protein
MISKEQRDWVRKIAQDTVRVLNEYPWPAGTKWFSAIGICTYRGTYGSNTPCIIFDFVNGVLWDPKSELPNYYILKNNIRGDNNCDLNIFCHDHWVDGWMKDYECVWKEP